MAQADIIKMKIETRKEQIKEISMTGPYLAGALGALVCLTIIGIIPGLIICGFAVWWGNNREKERKKLVNEIKELEAELL